MVNDVESLVDGVGTSSISDWREFIGTERNPEERNEDLKRGIKALINGLLILVSIICLGLNYNTFGCSGPTVMYGGILTILLLSRCFFS